MLAYLVAMVHAFVPMAIMAGLFLALVAGKGTNVKGVWILVAAIAIGLALGAFSYRFALDQGSPIGFRTFLAGLATVSVFLIVIVSASAQRLAKVPRSAVVGIGWVTAAGIAVQAMFTFLTAVSGQGLSVTSVLNTELILNIGAILAGTVVIAIMVALMFRSARDNRVLAGAILIVTAALQTFVWGNGIVLGLLQLQLLEVTSGRISFVAKASELAPLAVYGQLACALFVGAVRFSRRPRTPTDIAANRIARRKRLAAILAERRWWRGVAAALSFLAVTLLYHDLYASLPPSLSPAQAVAADETGAIRIPVETVKDGNLHRFAYVTSDGHRVRFFLINRYDAEHVKIGVVFDACMICGDDGYIQRGGEIICIACNVRIFVPSIGKPGGCNPVPLEHEADGETITIKVSSLEKGAKYFSEVVEIEVEDPVTGARLLNLTAPHQYEYKGRMFYFGGPESYEKFKGDPERYAGDFMARAYRVQGHQQ